jgi:HD-GYP domain-containing protein (c-di-GMP phosphodiesterase class II)
MKEFVVKDIPEGSFFSKPVYIDDRFLVIVPEVDFSPSIAHILTEWGFPKVLCEGESRKSYYSEDVEGIPEVLLIEKNLDGDEEQIRKAEKFFHSFLYYVETIFTQMAVGHSVRFSDVAEKIKEVCDMTRENRRQLLRVMRDAEPGTDQNYLASHSAKSTILSIIIGSYLKLPNHRLIELGVAAVFHEAGMIKLPPQIYLNKRGLTLQERKAIYTHPILSYNMLKSFDFPLTVSVAALEHHERENGSGYPRKMSGDRISLYAKIIAVVCSYEALSSKRPHKEAKDGYTGIVELLKNEGKQYDDTVIRALVFSLSIYPIGLYVLLSNGKKGQVVDVNPENPRFPIVQIFGELNPDGKNKVMETSKDGLYIIRPLVKEEITAPAGSFPGVETDETRANKTGMSQTKGESS